MAKRDTAPRSKASGPGGGYEQPPQTQPRLASQAQPFASGRAPDFVGRYTADVTKVGVDVPGDRDTDDGYPGGPTDVGDVFAYLGGTQTMQGGK